MISVAFYVASISLMLVAFWGWFALEQTTGLRLVNKFAQLFKAADAPLREPLPVAFPLIATAVLVVGGFLHYRRQVDFVQHAQVVTGTITSIGSLAQASLRDVSYEFEFAGKLYATRKSLSEATVVALNVGDTVELLVDPRNPARNGLLVDYLLFEDVDDDA